MMEEGTWSRRSWSGEGGCILKIVIAEGGGGPWIRAIYPMESPEV